MNLSLPRSEAIRHLQTVLLTVGALALLVWLARQASWADVRAGWQRLPAWAWAIAAAGMAGTYLLRAYRLRHEWRTVARVRFRTALQVVMWHSVAIQWLPLRAGELVYPVLVKRHFGGGLAEAASSLVWLRLQDACVLGAFAVLLLPTWPIEVRLLFLLAAGTATAGLLPWGLRVLRRRGGRFGAAAAALLEHRNDATGWVCCVSHWALKLAVIGALLAVLAGAGPAAGQRGALGGEIAGALPLQGPAGIGSYELGVWAAMRLGDAPPLGPVVVAAVLVHAFVAIVAALGAGAAWALHTPTAAPSDPLPA
jgi:hypothetical protein